MRVIELEIAEDSQPQGPFEPSQDFAPKFLWVGPARTRLVGSRPFDSGTYSGTETSTAAGIALAHNGSSQHENWVINEPNSAYPVLIGGSFVVTQTSTANQTAVGVGGATLAGGMYLGVGQYTAGTVGSWGRVAISGADAAINGPTAVIGQRYNVVRVSRSATDHVMYVNGVRYSSSTNSSTANDSWKNFSIGTTVRDTTPVFYGRQSVHLGFFDRVDPGEEWMRNWSLNEWSIFEPQTISIAVTSSGGGVTGSLAATESGSDTASIAGAVRIYGALAATESGADTAAVAGTVSVVGSLAATESGSDTAEIVGAGALSTVTGSLAATESGADVAAVAGDVYITGSLAATESGSDTAAITNVAAAGFTKYFDVLSGQLLILRAL